MRKLSRVNKENLQTESQPRQHIKNENHTHNLTNRWWNKFDTCFSWEVLVSNSCKLVFWFMSKNKNKTKQKHTTAPYFQTIKIRNYLYNSNFYTSQLEQYNKKKNWVKRTTGKTSIIKVLQLNILMFQSIKLL